MKRFSCWVVCYIRGICWLKIGDLSINWISGFPSSKHVLDFLPCHRPAKGCQITSCTCVRNKLKWTESSSCKESYDINISVSNHDDEEEKRFNGTCDYSSDDEWNSSRVSILFPVLLINIILHLLSFFMCII